jgi:hypothetical protein
MACLPTTELTGLTRDAVNSWHHQFQVILDQLKETTYFPGRESHRIDVVPRQHPADAVEYKPDIRQESLWHAPCVCHTIALIGPSTQQ